jgi:hypothetical protein
MSYPNFRSSTALTNRQADAQKTMALDLDSCPFGPGFDRQNDRPV